MKEHQPDSADIAIGQIDGGPRAPVTHADVDYWIKRTKESELELTKAGFKHDLMYALQTKLADAMLATKAELEEWKGKATASLDSGAKWLELYESMRDERDAALKEVAELQHCAERNAKAWERALAEARGELSALQIDTLRKRLQFDPGGSNRIDALEQALELLQRKQDCLKAELEELQRLVDIDAREKASPHALARTRRGGDG